jgi:hypothetical protein
MMSIFLLFLFISSLVDVLHVKYMEDDVNLVIMWSCNPQSRLRSDPGMPILTYIASLFQTPIHLKLYPNIENYILNLLEKFQLYPIVWFGVMFNSVKLDSKKFYAEIRIWPFLIESPTSLMENSLASCWSLWSSFLPHTASNNISNKHALPSTCVYIFE